MASIWRSVRARMTTVLAHQESSWAALTYVQAIRAWRMPVAVALMALALYLRTGAPTILTGDQAEHQTAAALVGVPHATGYPLFTIVNALAVRVIPVGDAARRVTMMTGVWSALAVTLAFVLTRRLCGSPLAALTAATMLAIAPRFWALATIAEVYTLQALLILGVWWYLHRWWDDPTRGKPLWMAALCVGLATTHHGSFVPIVYPALALTVAPVLWQTVASAPALYWRSHLAAPLVYGILGLSPWLYLILQYLIFQPFDYYRGQGLPYHYYWGNPASWSDVVNLALGAGFRGEILVYGWERMPELLLRFGSSLRGELSFVGLVLAAVGVGTLALRQRRDLLLSAAVFVCAALFGVTIAGDIPKAPVYFLPAYVMGAIWAGIGAATLAQLGAGLLRLPSARAVLPVALLTALLAVSVARGWRLFSAIDRSANLEPRHFAEGVLAEVAPRAVILCRWEQCQAIQYLQLIERQRLDVVLDQTEPEDGVSWADRAAIYAAERSVYAIGYNQQLAEQYMIYPLSETYDLWQVRLPP